MHTIADMSMLIPSLPSLIHSSTIVVSVIFPLLSLLAICMRWGARRKSKQSFHSDDYWIVISWVPNSPSCVLPCTNPEI